MRIEALKQNDIQSAAALVERVFDLCIAPNLTSEGISTFKSGQSAEAIESRLLAGNPFVACKSGSAIVGVGELRDVNHLNLLFVDEGQQGQGIGKRMLKALTDPLSSSEVTVNASLNAITAYRAMGFVESGAASEVRGITFQPMRLILHKS